MGQVCFGIWGVIQGAYTSKDSISPHSPLIADPMSKEDIHRTMRVCVWGHRTNQHSTLWHRDSDSRVRECACLYRC